MDTLQAADKAILYTLFLIAQAIYFQRISKTLLLLIPTTGYLSFSVLSLITRTLLNYRSLLKLISLKPRYQATPVFKYC